MAIKTILTFLVLVLSISCKSQVKNESKNEFSIKTNEIQINEMLLNALKKTKNEFINKFRKEPTIIILEFNSNNSFSIENRTCLYTSREEESLLNYTFIGGSTLNGVIILVKKNEYEFHKKFLKIKGLITSFNFNYSSSMDFCFNKFVIDKKSLVLIDSYCSFDVFTE